MEKKVKDFVRLYNRNIEWNKDIFSELELKYILKSEYVKVISDYISFKKITKRVCDIEHAKVYEYEGSGTLEMQAFSYETYGTRYFWTHPNLDEDAYKKKKIKDITEVLTKHRKDAVKRMQEASSELEEINEVLEFISAKNKTWKDETHLEKCSGIVSVDPIYFED